MPIAVGGILVPEFEGYRALEPDEMMEASDVLVCINPNSSLGGPGSHYTHPDTCGTRARKERHGLTYAYASRFDGELNPNFYPYRRGIPKPANPNHGKAYAKYGMNKVFAEPLPIP